MKGTKIQKEIFYTALYHTMIQPNTMSDVNGEYMVADYTPVRWATMKLIIPPSPCGILSVPPILFTLLEPERVTDLSEEHDTPV